MISTAAGMIVTRVASEDEGAARSHLGRDIGAQVLAHPKALAFAAGLLRVLALVPGLPAAPFLILAAAIGLVAWKLLRDDAGERAAPFGLARELARAGGGPRRAAAGDIVGRPLSLALSSSSSPAPAPLAIELSAALSAELGGAAAARRLAATLVPGVAGRLFAETGLALPTSPSGRPRRGWPRDRSGCCGTRCRSARATRPPARRPPSSGSPPSCWR